MRRRGASKTLVATLETKQSSKENVQTLRSRTDLQVALVIRELAAKVYTPTYSPCMGLMFGLAKNSGWRLLSQVGLLE